MYNVLDDGRYYKLMLLDVEVKWIDTKWLVAFNEVLRTACYSEFFVAFPVRNRFD